MAAIDKMMEFYTCLSRFAFLCSNYAPKELKKNKEVLKALKTIQEYEALPEIRVKINEAAEWFDKMDKYMEKMHKKEIISYLAKDL